MKQTLLILLALLSCLTLLSCDPPMQRHYNSETWIKDVGEASTPGTDSMNRIYCMKAIIGNDRQGIDNDQYTYAELIKQGMQIKEKEKVNTFVDSLNKANGTDMPLIP